MPELREVIASTGMDPHSLQLEITEGVFLSRPEIVGRVLDAIRSLGVRIALDDFGTGYSSLGYLDRYPIDTIKIDRSFVVKMLTRRRTLAIVETIIALGQALSLDIVAEGVDDEEQLETLLALKCNSIQGYLFARPMPPSDMDALCFLQVYSGAPRPSGHEARLLSDPPFRAPAIGLSPVAKREWRQATRGTMLDEGELNGGGVMEFDHG